MNVPAHIETNQCSYTCCDVISRAFCRARMYPMAKKGVADLCYNVHNGIKVFLLCR